MLAGLGGLVGAAAMLFPAFMLAAFLSGVVPLTAAALTGYSVVLASFLFAFLKSYTFLVGNFW